jgi:hypothetical protein
MMDRRSGGARSGGLVLGLLLVVGGAALLAAQYLGWDIRLDLANYGWPIYVVVPGLLLLVIGLITFHEAGVGLSIAGSIVTTVGLILAYQWTSGNWASWAYAWTLIPAAVGVGMLLWGVLHLRWSIVRGGLGSLGVGLVMFLVFFGFFEGLVGLGDDEGLREIARSALPIALIVAGLLVIVGRFWPRGRHEPAPDRWMAARPMGGPEPPPMTPPMRAAEPQPFVAEPPPTGAAEREPLVGEPPSTAGRDEWPAADRPSADLSADAQPDADGEPGGSRPEV